MDKFTGNLNALNKKNSEVQETGQYLALPNPKLTANQQRSNDKNANYCINNNLTASAKELQALKLKLVDDSSSNGGSPPVYEDGCLLTERGLWESKLDFVFGCISYAVGLGNVWRFPYLVYEQGGGAFLIPWILSIFLCGIPMFVFEVALGQLLNTGGICVWNLVPIFKGIGYASMVMIGLCNIYYIVLISYTIYYFIISFQYHLPWTNCDENLFCINKNWANLTEVLKYRNLTLNDTRLLTPVKNYWENDVLKITSGINEMGTIRWPLLCCLFVAWLMVYLVIWRGLHKSGKIIWFSACFPYLILSILFVRGITLEGATYGLKYLFTPDWSKLAESRVWVSASTQVLFSYGIGIGTNIALGSYNRYHHNFYRDSIIACAISSGTSLFSAIVIFSVIGHMAYTENVDISKVAQSGPGLAFIAFPEVVLKFGPSAHIFAILFFLMLIVLGTDSQFCTVEAFVTGIVDEYARYLRPRRKLFTLIVCSASFALGIPLIMEGGIYVFTLMDYFSASGFSLMTVVFCEIAGLCWIYGADRIFSQMKDMLGFSPNVYMFYCWMYVSPSILIGLFIFSIVSYERVTYANTYTYPLWGELIGWCMGFASVICIPLYAILYILRQDGTLKERILKGFTSVVPPRKETETAYIDIDDISAMDIAVKEVQKETTNDKCNG